MNRILIVDDHPDIRRLLASALGKGHEPPQAEDGASALETVRGAGKDGSRVRLDASQDRSSIRVVQQNPGLLHLAYRRCSGSRKFRVHRKAHGDSLFCTVIAATHYWHR
ncbi:MAG: response regulator [Betaproteobacteria bacterium]